MLPSQTAYPSVYGGPYQFAPPPSSFSAGRSVFGCLVGVIFLALLWWFFSRPTGCGTYNYAEANPAGGTQVKMQSVVHPQQAAHCNVPTTEAKSGAPEIRPDMLGAVQVSARPDPGKVKAVSPGMATQAFQRSDPGAGAPLGGDTFSLSPASQEYLETFNPSGLQNIMPSGWRAPAAGQKCDPTDDGQFAEFSRYAVSPQMVQRSETMRSVMRHGENTRNGLGRTLGYQSLLRNYVTPSGAIPIGNSVMPFNDSQVRQSYIAAATGEFPNDDAC